MRPLIFLIICFMPFILTYTVKRSIMLDHLYMPSICGKKDAFTTDLILGGKETEAHEWPWLVALYTAATNGLKFRCGGSLISSNLVVTAAHCLKNLEKNNSDLVVYLRKYSQYVWGDNDDSIAKTVINWEIHNLYKERLASDSDIAVLVLESPVTFTVGVQPVCLPLSEKKTEANIIGQVVGWGMTNESRVSEFPLKAEMPVVSYETCRNSHSSYQDPNILTDNIFCAGKRDGTGPCVGDSGGGFYVNYKTDDGHEKWKLQGIVSRALRDKKNTCLTDQYFMFTDVTRFVPWINKVAKNNMPHSLVVTTTEEQEAAKLLKKNTLCTAQLPKLLKNFKYQVADLKEETDNLYLERNRLRKDFARAHKFEVKLNATYNAGIAAFKKGDYPTALKSMSAVLEIRRRLSGENHNYTLNNKAVVAALLSQQERHVEAEKLYSELAEVPISRLKAAHVNRMDVLLQLAREQTELNKTLEALTTYDQAISEMQKKNPVNNSEILGAQREKANVLALLSRYEEVYKIHSDILNSLPETSIEVIVTSLDLSRTLNLLKKHQEAYDILNNTMTNSGKITLPSKESNLLKFEIASTLEYLGRYDEAIDIYS